MLSMVFSIQPVWNTFMHPWRVELCAAIFLFSFLAYIIRQGGAKSPKILLSTAEFNWLVLPVCVFIFWSALSMLWAPSWKSTLHHTLIWSLYLIFYITVRQLLEGGRSYGKLLNTAALSLAFLAVLAIFSYCAFLIFGGGTRIGIVYAKYGEQVNTIFPLLTLGVLRLNGKRFLQGSALLTALWLLVFCSLSRTNLFLFAVATSICVISVFVFKHLNRYRRKMSLLCLIFVITPSVFQIFSFDSADSSLPIVTRVRNEQSISSSNDFRKLMITLSLEMFKQNPLIGVGADNFGFETNKYRASYASNNPDDSNLAQGETEIPERSHNEYLQILAELGIIGGLIFGWLLFGIALMGIRALTNVKRTTPHSWAALLGIALFLASSLVTSYSFRLVQNGFVFFFVLAVAAKLLIKTETGDGEREIRMSERQLRIGYYAALGVCVLMMVLCTVRAGSVMYTTDANYTVSLEDSKHLYDTAMRLDDENPEAHYFLGFRLLEQRRYAEAVPHLRASINVGKARSEDFWYLASAQTLADDYSSAEQTFSEAARLYPRSPFVLVRYAALLEKNGKTDEAAAFLDKAKRINLRQANTWWATITASPQVATDLAFQNDEYDAVMDLQPQAVMFAVKAERQVRFPEEKFAFELRSDDVRGTSSAP